MIPSISAANGISLIDEKRLVVIDALVRLTSLLPGDMAEFGVYRGGSAKVIADACPDKLLHLFDTWEGIPEDDQEPTGKHLMGEFKADLEECKKHMGEAKCEYHVGKFQDRIVGLEHLEFAFVHMDADIWSSTICGLEYFWQRIVSGGVLVMDDYDWQDTPAIIRAVRIHFEPHQVHMVDGLHQCFIFKR